MTMHTNFTPQHWEFGFGFYIPKWFINKFTNRKSRKAAFFDLFLGPFSVSFIFGQDIEVIE